MKKFLVKSLCLFIPVFLMVVSVNFFVDPANVFRSSVVDKMMEYFDEYAGVEIVGDFNEGALLEKRIAKLERTPDTMVMGSSHVLYVDWQFNDYINVGMSGEFLDDYFATVGLLEEYGRLPNKLVIAVDPYIFLEELSIRQDSLQYYSDMEKALAKGDKFTGKHKSGLSGNRIKELFSFSYFQSSFDAMIHGIRGAMVEPVNDISVGEKTKILKNGKRVPGALAYVGADRCTWDAEWYVSQGSIHVMTEFSDLYEPSVKEFEYLIDRLILLDVDVELYLPSWFYVYYDEFASNPDFAGVLKAEEYIRNMAAERDVTVHGSYDPYLAGAQAEHYLDSMHLMPEYGWSNYLFVK